SPLRTRHRNVGHPAYGARPRLDRYGSALRPPPSARLSRPIARTTTPSTASSQPMLADIPATPPKPSSAAMRAITKKVTAQFSIVQILLCSDRATVMPAQAPAVSTDFVPFDCRLENLPDAGCRAYVSRGAGGITEGRGRGLSVAPARPSYPPPAL